MVHSIEGAVIETRRCLEAGDRVVVTGWMSRFHNDFTRSLSEKMVVFLDPDCGKSVPQNTGIILSTPLISHSRSDQIVSMRGIKLKTMSKGQIKATLEECSDLLLPSDKNDLHTSMPISPVTLPPETIPQEKEDCIMVKAKVLTAPSEEDRRFAARFFETVGSDPEARLSTAAVTKLAAEIYPRSPGKRVRLSKLSDKGLLEGLMKEGGQRVNSYKAGPRLLEIYTAPVSGSEEISPRTPSNKIPMDKIMEIVESGPDLQSQRSALKDELSELEVRRVNAQAKLYGIDKKLERVKKANELMAEFAKLFD